MIITESLKELVQNQIARDSELGTALLCESIEAMLAGDIETGKAILRNYIKATVGFKKLAESTDMPAKSLSRNVRSPRQSADSKPARCDRLSSETSRSAIARHA